MLEVANTLFPTKNLRVEACGSFRRGKDTCGDVDILLTANYNVDGGKDVITMKEQLREMRTILPTLISKLEEKKFLVERLGADRVAKTGSQTYMGICEILDENNKTKYRRIDIKVYPSS